jgi:lysozyme family protein
MLNSVNNQTQTPIAGAGHDYQHLLGETVNFSNGSVSLKMGFPVPSGRGITYHPVWSYNSAAVNPLDAVGGNTPTWDNPTNHPWPTKGNYIVG